MRTYSSFCGTVCSDSTGTVTSDAAVRLHRRYHGKDNLRQLNHFIFLSCGTEQHHDKHLNQGTKPISSPTSKLVQHVLHMT